MRFVKKFVTLMLMIVLVLNMFGNIQAEAEETGIPTISFKYVNNKTGVKVTVGKTEGAVAYKIYLKGYGDKYLEYWSESAKIYCWRQVGYIPKDGSAKRTYTINGLPKGTYTIKVATIAETEGYNGTYKFEDTYSLEKTFKIKAAKPVNSEENSYDFSKTKVGDIISFGSYEQDGIMTNGKEEIEWIVLSKTKSQMFVVSKYILDCLQYNPDSDEKADNTWEKSSLRKWLNNSFYKTAFSKSERSMIKKTKLKNADNATYGTKGGKDTKDYIFLLSLDDVINSKYRYSNKLDDTDINRRIKATPYAVIQGAPNCYYEPYEGIEACCWWTRSPGLNSQFATYVHFDGYVMIDGYHVAYTGVTADFIGVRPALVINLK